MNRDSKQYAVTLVNGTTERAYYYKGDLELVGSLVHWWSRL